MMNWTRMIWRNGWIAPGCYEEKDKLIIFFKSSWCTIAGAARNWINFVPPQQKPWPSLLYYKSFFCMAGCIWVRRARPAHHSSRMEQPTGPAGIHSPAACRSALKPYYPNPSELRKGKKFTSKSSWDTDEGWAGVLKNTLVCVLTRLRSTIFVIHLLC